jgi:ferrous iron transport protein B
MTPPTIPSNAPASETGATEPGEAAIRRVALLGNPNTGKTTLFNRISGLRHKTSNFPGTTLDARVARVRAGAEGGRDADLVDLPGVYSLELDQLESRIAREVLAGTAAPRGEPLGAPECVVIVTDATNLMRNLMLVGEVLRRRLPTVVVLNMMDLAERAGVAIDAGKLSAALGCEVVSAIARTGEGIDAIRRAIRSARIPAPSQPVPGSKSEHADEHLREWAETMYAAAVPGAGGAGADGATAAREAGRAAGRALSAPDNLAETKSDKADRVLLQPVLGLAVFALVMTGLFYAIFSLAALPMDLIDHVFSCGAGLAESVLPAGAVRELLVNGIIGGVGSTVIFLPQICLLFFLISLLEDTGYLARGAFLMDRLLRPFGLPGQSFVPLLSSHACALPGIMSTRGIPDQKERLTTILVAPFMTCSARLPVYVLLTAILFADKPIYAALAFVGCYALGIFAGVGSALLARRTILRGKSRAMAMELPSFKWPSLRSALVTTYDRGLTFLRKAGTVILAICIVLWWLGAYPKVEPPAAVAELRSQAEARAAASDKSEDASALELGAQADRLEASHAKTSSFMGMIGRTVQPVFAPLGFDWQLTVGVMASFAAREVFVSTMAVVVTGNEDADSDGVLEQVGSATRDDGATLVFTPAVSWAALVFFVLAMQCLPTLAVTAREAGSVRWALLQLGWMSAVAYLSALLVYQLMR